MEETMKKTGITIKNNAESTDIHIIGEIGSDYSVDDLKKDLKNCKKTINMYILACNAHRLIRDRFCSSLPFCAPRLLNKRRF
jgi:hypothetical protein